MSPTLNPADPPPAGARRLDQSRFEELWDSPRLGACACCDEARLGRALPANSSTTRRPQRRVLPPLGRVSAGKVATWGLLASNEQVAFLVGGAS